VGADVYIAVSKEVTGALMEKNIRELSLKVFRRDLIRTLGKWAKNAGICELKGKNSKRCIFFYTNMSEMC